MAADTTAFAGLQYSVFRIDSVEPVESNQMASGAITASLGDPLWVVTMTLADGPSALSRASDAVLSRLRRPGQTLTVYDPTVNGPAADPKGILLGESAPVIGDLDADGVSLTIEALPAGYVLSPGDWLGVTVGSVPQLYRVVIGAQADASGTTPLIEVEPPIRFDVTEGLALTLVRPVMLARVVTYTSPQRTPWSARGWNLVLEQVFTA